MENFEWTGKEVLLIIRDDLGKKLVFNAEVINLDDNSITFEDKFGVIFFYPRESILKMQIKEEEDLI